VSRNNYYLSWCPLVAHIGDDLTCSSGAVMSKLSRSLVATESITAKSSFGKSSAPAAFTMGEKVENDDSVVISADTLPVPRGNIRKSEILAVSHFGKSSSTRFEGPERPRSRYDDSGEEEEEEEEDGDNNVEIGDDDTSDINGMATDWQLKGGTRTNESV
jgi:hypothetical protein